MSEQYPGGFVTKTPPTPVGPYENSSGYGIWNLSQQAGYAAQGLWPTAGSLPPDAQFNYVTMLLHGDGTNGAQNNTFLDSSTNNFTITRNGNTTQGSFSPYGSNWSNYFDGGTVYTLPDNAALELGANDFTIEAWVNLNSLPTSGNAHSVISKIDSGNISYGTGILNDGGVMKMTFNYSTNGSSYAGQLKATASIAANTWYHVAWVRNGSSLKMFLNGTEVSSGLTISGTIWNSTYPTEIGVTLDHYSYFAGYMSNLRLVNGTAVYTSNFTPSTTPLTAITNTALLTFQSNRVVDKSSNAFALTLVRGSPSVQRFNPFGTSTAYSTATIGGSGYFDGSGDYLQLADSSALDLGSSNYTMELWCYPTSFATDFDLFTYKWDNQLAGNRLIAVYSNTSGVITAYFNDAGNAIGASIALKLNSWNHVALVRNGTTVTLYINGASAGTGTMSGAYTNRTHPTVWGAGYSSSTDRYYTTGYITDFRVVIGSAVYTSAFTPPTAPLTAISGTAILSSMTNGAIYDNAMMNDLETVGNAQISTSVKKFGTGSLYFDGTGDYLAARASPNFAFGTGDFTIECWLYVSSNPAQYTCIMSNWAGSDPAWLLDFSNGSGNIRFNDSGAAYLTSSSALPTGQWNHVAVTRSGTSLKMFFNGSEVASATNSTSFGSASSGLFVGAYYNNTYPLNGYIDDLRITKGYARTITTPTAAFPNIGPT